MTVPVLDAAALAPDALLALLQEHGAALVHDASLPAAHCARVLADAAAFFALPASAKERLAIARSPHFRGYSVLHNERDWREQVHFGRELAAVVAPSEAFWRLQGPNRWPGDDAFRARMLHHLAMVEALGRRLLDALATALGQRAEAWLGGEPYLLLKCIGYHPQPAGAPVRRGVAAHLDFSLLTLTLQDDVGGLEVQRPDGAWLVVPPVPGALLLNVGELLHFVTGGALRATPHRVVNPSHERLRCSLPVFVAPALDATIHAPVPPRAMHRPRAAPPDEHVHAVLDVAVAPRGALHFGAAEWRRKGENVWCSVCCGSSTAGAAPG